jgi:type II secretory pathway predicted ATPase ExeA
MKNSFSDNEYYRAYELEKDPFPEDVINKSIYLTPEIIRRLKQAKQHIKTSKCVLIISACSGAGKSLLAEKLIILKEADWKVSLTHANSDLEPDAIAHSIIKQLWADKDIQIAQSISMMHKYLETSDKEQLTPVIVIDDADKLSFTSLQFILQLADLRYNDSFFRFVLFANESITETIAKPGLVELADGTIEHLSMPSFSLEQLSAYLKYRFSSCGDITELPFDESDLEYLHTASGGLPGGINILARRLMQSRLESDKPVRSNVSIYLIIILLLVVFAGYQYQQIDTLKDESQRKPVEISNKSISANAGENDQVKIVEVDTVEIESTTRYEPISLKLSETLQTQTAESFD